MNLQMMVENQYLALRPVTSLRGSSVLHLLEATVFLGTFNASDILVHFPRSLNQGFV